MRNVKILSWLFNDAASIYNVKRSVDTNVAFG
jgi:hypothetical protein